MGTGGHPQLARVGIRWPAGLATPGMATTGRPTRVSFDRLQSSKSSFISCNEDSKLREHAVPILAYKVALGCELGLIEQLKEGRLIE